MQHTKHTPGPWRIAMEENGLYVPGHTPISTQQEEGRDQWDGLAQVVTILDGETSLVGQANARLIAAAPEMLEALEVLVGSDGYEVDCIGMDMARAAIAKAKAA